MSVEQADEATNRPSSPPPQGRTGSSTKRAASPSFEGLDDTVSRKRFREGTDSSPSMTSNCDVHAESSNALSVTGTTSSPTLSSMTPPSSSTTTAMNKYSVLVEDLVQELQCGCCSELVYRPVVVSPCQHFFCGSCCVLWIKNGGTNCPACRGVSTHVTSSRPLQTMLDVLLRSDPSRTRTERERMQADEVYKPGQPMRIPAPREPSPEPNFNDTPDWDYARPCPHCAADNQFGWACPQPIVDYATDPERAWHVDDGAPPGHAYCGNCESLLALQAPITTKCDFCQVSFCGISVHGRCIALPLNTQQPHDMNDLGDFVQSSEIYECFDSNFVEVEILFDYLTTRQITPKKIYRDIVLHIQAQPHGFRPLIESGVFAEIHAITVGIDEDPGAIRTRICRHCAADILLWGLKEWWVREREIAIQKGLLQRRPDCEAGSSCSRQKDLAHTKEFNHVIIGTPVLPQSSTGDALSRDDTSHSGTSNAADSSGNVQGRSNAPGDRDNDHINDNPDPVGRSANALPPVLSEEFNQAVSTALLMSDIVSAQD
ncbi:hypothetical protein BKA83DRAFT_4232205 [Pisolithus microcarpus]|nr:hypothetical protein BKA83DRAFT_4232205 [Pisolithus microcarpus]